MLPIIFMVILSGCQTLVETNIKLSELQTLKSNKVVNSDLYVQVAACNDFQDSRKESSSVVQSKQTIPSIFEDAKYVECFMKEFESYTHFTIPTVLTNGQVLDANYINILSNQKHLLSVGIPSSIKSSIERVKSNSYGMTALDLNIQISLENDTQTTVEFRALSAYVNGSPSIYDKASVESSKSVKVVLSDVSTDNALENGSSHILFYDSQ